MMKRNAILRFAAVFSAGMLSVGAMAQKSKVMFTPEQMQEISSMEAPPMPHDVMERMIADDDKKAKAGMLPPELVKIEIEMDKLGDEGRAVYAKHDTPGILAWSKKMRVLETAESQILNAFTNKQDDKMIAAGLVIHDDVPLGGRARGGRNNDNSAQQCVITVGTGPSGPITELGPCN